MPKRFLAQIGEEIDSLKKVCAGMQAQWTQEKKFIEEKRRLQENIERTSQEAGNAEREGSLEKAAELKYGALPRLQKEANDLDQRLKETQTAISKASSGSEQASKAFNKRSLRSS